MKHTNSIVCDMSLLLIFKISRCHPERWIKMQEADTSTTCYIEKIHIIKIKRAPPLKAELLKCHKFACHMLRSWITTEKANISLVVQKSYSPCPSQMSVIFQGWFKVFLNRLLGKVRTSTATQLLETCFPTQLSRGGSVTLVLVR